MIEYTVKVWPDGTKQWCLNGTKEWWLNGKRHREDGPAYEGLNGIKEWYLNGERVTEQEVLSLKAPCNGREVVIDGVTYKLQRV